VVWEKEREVKLTAAAEVCASVRVCMLGSKVFVAGQVTQTDFRLEKIEGKTVRKLECHVIC